MAGSPTRKKAILFNAIYSNRFLTPIRYLEFSVSIRSLLFTLILVPALASAQTQDSEMIRKLIERINQLETRVAELEPIKTGGAAVPNPAEAAATPTPSTGGMAGMPGMTPPNPDVAVETSSLSYP